MSHKENQRLVIDMRTLYSSSGAQQKLAISMAKKKISSLSLVTIMLLSLFATIQIGVNQVSAASDQDGDGLTYGLEYLMNTAPNDPDSDNDGLPDGWEWLHGLDPLSANNADGAVGDPDGDGMSNLQEYTYLMPSGWDSSTTPSVLDNGVWWNGTVPTNGWNEEGALVYNQPACGGSGSDGTGNTILCDEDPVGNICTNGFDDDKDGLVDSADPDNDGDADCSSDDDDGDGIADEDVAGWDTDGDGMPDGWEVSYGLNATSPSNNDGANGDPDGDGLNNLNEYVNPSWTTLCNGLPCWNPGPNGQVTETTSPCDPVSGIGPGGCASLTAEVDGITSTNPTRADTDGDGLNDSYEALTLLTDPTASDTDGDGISDGVEVNSAYGEPAQSTDPRDNNTDDDAFDDGDEDTNGNGVLDAGETDPTRREDAGDFDNDGIQNWEENLSCTAWDIADTDFGGVNDGDERNVSHGTDPCDSLTDFTTTISSWNSLSSQLTVADGSGFNPSGGVGWFNSSGTWVSFGYIAVVNNVLQSVNPGPANGVTEVANRNGSFCHTSATNDGTIGTTRSYCDDDYTDGDGDGLADWEELLGTYGWFSNPTLVDTDADGVPDFQEAVLDNTDPNDPCLNLLDSDGDGLNNYFENSTGCTLDSIGITNGSSDVWVTGWDQVDTDNGGVGDRNEYFDGTNPENDPSDDLLPDDFDGDGIPDAVENASSTDWRNPDTDGGGMMDGAECPQQFWFFNCVGAPFNPLDPSDDQINNDIIFWANNTTGTVDIEQPHYWRLTTSDFYTGSTYAHLNSVHPAAEVITPITNLTNLADLSFANDTVTWNIVYNYPIASGNVPQPYWLSNISYWTDAGAMLLRSNDTHTLSIDSGSLEILLTQQPEYYFDWATLASTTIGHTNSTYATILPDSFSNSSLAESQVRNISNGVITDAGALDAYSRASALADFLVNGNATTEFKRNYNGSMLPSDADLTMHMLNIAREGTCTEFATTFVTMARSIGLPARLVSGYQDGVWTGTGYAVYASSRTTWGEVRLQQNAANGNTDLGWIPFESCPEPENLTIANQSISTFEWDRNGSQDITVSGQLLYADNSTPIPDIPLVAYLVRTDEINDVPGAAAVPGREFGSIITDSNGNFTINGTPTNPILPGFTQIVINHKQSGYVGDDGIAFDDILNVTDDSEIVHIAPNAINSPVVGAGATTLISGLLQLESNPQLIDDYYDGLSVWLSYTSSVDGAQNLTGEVQDDGSWSIEVTLDPLETKTNLSAILGFSGWTDTGQSFTSPVHIRDSTQPINLDVRDAPNLTATVEGPGANSSIIDLDDFVYINGTAVSFGAVPTNMEGMLSFRMRENDSGGDFIEIFNQSVNGSFSIQYFLNASLIPVASGEIEMILRFYPTQFEATDDANLSSGAPYALRGVLTYEVDAQSQLRGGPANLLIQLYDHRGASVGLDVPGNYDFTFNNSWVNTTVDPASTLLNLAFDIDANMFAGDYPFGISFNGSSLYVPNTASTTVRVMAEIGWNLSSADDWVHIGNSTFITGDFYDAVHNTRVTGNDTLLTLVLLTDEGPVDLALGQLDNATGEFNLTAIMPTNLPSGVYTIEVAADFLSLAPPGGAYYTWVDTATPPSPPNSITIEVGIESEVVIQPEQESLLILSGDTIDLRAKIMDIADMSNVSGSTVEFIFDYGRANTSIGTVTSDAEGNATLQWTASDIAPGYYDLQVLVADDTSAPLVAGNTRRTGNTSLINVTVQSTTSVVFDVVPSNITAGQNFNVQGRVVDGLNSSRPMVSRVQVSAYWEDEPEELLVRNTFTALNGSFNLSVPTDTENDGTTRGIRTLVVEVVPESSPFYLGDQSNASILVFGVTQFDNLNPRNPVIINRGETVNLSAKLVEATDLFTPLPGYQVGIMFHESWVADTTTDGEGYANASFILDNNHPLGLITAMWVFNGSTDLRPGMANLSTVTVRSLTFMVIDDIAANPVAGDSFNVSGQVTSDNGSGIETRDGITLPSNVLFRVNGEPSGFTVTGGAIGTGGFWNATITLGQGFEAGNNTIQASFVPTVNYYVGSENETFFDSRGYSILNFQAPVLDGLGQPSLNDRTERGENVSIRLSLLDNTGAPVANQTITVGLTGTQVTGFAVTNSNGIAFTNLTVPANMSVGVSDLNAEFAGIPGTTGLINSSAETSFVVLAETSITITEYSEAVIGGERLFVNGSLLDDLGLVLQSQGSDSAAIVHLLVDGIPVSSVETSSTDGSFALSYLVPSSTSPGAHQIQVQFKGGRDWVDPIGVGDPGNPEYYLPSNEIVEFNVSMETILTIYNRNGEVNRESTMTIEGLFTDITASPLVNMTLEVYLDGQFLTNVVTNEDGSFTAVNPVPADATLGPVSLEVRFTGTQLYLPSNDTGTWTVFSEILVTVNIPSTISVNENITITGSVVDNQLVGIEGHAVSLSIEGVNLGVVFTDASGNFEYQYIVPDLFTIGNHTITADVNSQGYYREGTGNATFFLAHRTGVSIDLVDGRDVTRGERWTASGRLFDIDDPNQIGLSGMQVDIYLDGELIGSTTTNDNGEWTYIVQSTLDMSRGDHTIDVRFEGVQAYIASSSSVVGELWANVVISIDAPESTIFTRSSDLNKIVLTGSVTEIGGEGEVFENIEMTLGNGTNCASSQTASRCLQKTLTFNNGNWTIQSIAPSWMTLGLQPVYIATPSNSSLHINTAESVQYIIIKVDATITVNPAAIIQGEEEDMRGTISIIADDTREGIPGIAFTMFLTNETGISINSDANPDQRVELNPVSDDRGIVTYQFNHDPPYGDYDEYGMLTVEISLYSGADILTQQSIDDFNEQRAQGFTPDYTLIEETSGAQQLVTGGIIVAIIAAIGAVLYFRKRQHDELLAEAAEIFAYTAELLAAGDSVREAIFQCYQNLCEVLQNRGFLRKDHETVREFESAIRAAMPSISEDALSGLDNIFEQARYSRDEMRDDHSQVAQAALGRMSAEIGQITKIPQR